MDTTTQVPRLTITCVDGLLLAEPPSVRRGESSEDDSARAMKDLLLAQQASAGASLAGLGQNLLPLAQEAAQYLERLGLQPLPAPRLRADDLRYLAGPLIVFDPAWGEDTPAWLRAKVRPARLGLLLAGEKELASEEEAVIYLTSALAAARRSADASVSASLAQPLDHEWCRTFLRLGVRLMARWGQVQTEADFWSMLGEAAPPLNGARDDEALRRLRSWLRRQATSRGARVQTAERGRNDLR